MSETKTEPTTREKLDAGFNAMCEFMDRAGLDSKRHNAHMTFSEGPSYGIAIYAIGDRRARLVEMLGEPTRDSNSSLRVALWQPTEERPFLVRCYYWFKDEHCSTCGR